MKRSKPADLLFLGITIYSFSASATVAATLDPLEEITNCARTEDRDARIACYEALGQRVLGQEAKAAEIVEDAEANAEEAAVSGDRIDEESPENQLIQGHVRSCQQAQDRRWFFIFDDGQVWKQSGGRDRRFKNCDFDVVIKKDVFGYKMAIAGDDQTVRVRRQK